jgi:hypothetical protein
MKIDFLFFAFNDDEYSNNHLYFKNMIISLYIMIMYQSIGGYAIIKLDNVYHKSIIDIIYTCSNIYNKVSLIKPQSTNILSNTRYLVCEELNNNVDNLLIKMNKEIKTLIHNNNNANNHKNKPYIYSFLKSPIPYYIINKIEDMNIHVAHQQLDAYNSLINIVKNNFVDSKIEFIKKNNILKCIQWCEKYKIPHNKFIDKINIFLCNKKDYIIVDNVNYVNSIISLV